VFLGMVNYIKIFFILYSYVGNMVLD